MIDRYDRQIDIHIGLTIILLLALSYFSYVRNVKNERISSVVRT